MAVKYVLGVNAKGKVPRKVLSQGDEALGLNHGSQRFFGVVNISPWTMICARVGNNERVASRVRSMSSMSPEFMSHSESHGRLVGGAVAKANT